MLIEVQVRTYDGTEGVWHINPRYVSWIHPFSEGRLVVKMEGTEPFQVLWTKTYEEFLKLLRMNWDN